MNSLFKASIICCLLSWIVIFVHAIDSILIQNTDNLGKYVIFICIVLNVLSLVLILLFVIKSIQKKRKLTSIIFQTTFALCLTVIAVLIFFAPALIEDYFRSSADIFEAIQRGRNSEVISFLENVPNCIKVTNSSGETVLHQAATYNNEKLVNLFIKRGVDINVRDINGFTPLHSAASTDGRRDGFGSARTMKALIANGANVNAIDLEGKTPLHYAARFGYYNNVKILLANHANPKLKSNDGLTPLDEARKQLEIQGEHYPELWIKCIELLKTH